MQTNETRLDFAAFKEELCRRVLELLGEAYSTELAEVRKNNGVLYTMMSPSLRNWLAISSAMPR